MPFLFVQTKGNTYQAVLATDGIRFYAIYTYKCGELNWANDTYTNDYAFIGFTFIPPVLQAEHPLSRKPNVTDIACINNDSSVWSNVLYTLHKKIVNITFDPPQFVSEIESVPYQVSYRAGHIDIIIMHAWFAAFRSTYQ